mmetsp:Transcript_70385/g.205861  ORF Transcript_70385/g.205861 Transcript_70385/m.205861 type:complete len:213 (-) Transcript_70385:3-641(-)
MIVKELADVLQHVQLLAARLPTAIHEVVPVDGSARAYHGTGWTLRAVIRVASYTILGSDFRKEHLQAVELRCNLENSARIPRVLVKCCSLSHSRPERQPAGGGRIRNLAQAFAKLSQGWALKLPNLEASSIGLGHKHCLITLQLKETSGFCESMLVKAKGLLEPGQCFLPFFRRLSHDGTHLPQFLTSRRRAAGAIPTAANCWDALRAPQTA